MIQVLALSMLMFGTDAMLFPMNNGAEPEPELLFVCPPPLVPQFGSIKCDYGSFDMSCKVQCDSGFQFEDGSHTASVMCNLFEGTSTPAMQKCVRIGGSVVSTHGPAVVTGFPSTSAHCVQFEFDCLDKSAGDYAYCPNCRQFATCSGSGLSVRDCPGISVFNATVDKCLDDLGPCNLVIG